MYLPELNPTAKRVLDILLSRGSVPGFELLKNMPSSKPEELIDAVTFLQDADLVQISGILTQERFPFATFAIRPSSKDLAQFVAKQKK
jgi:hypothetical protein